MSARFDPGVPFRTRPLLPFVVLLVAAGGFHSYLSLRALRSPPPVKTVLGWALLFRLVLVFSVPVQEDDFYRYLWDGKVTAAGLDPYLFSPEEVLRACDAPEPSRRERFDARLLELAQLAASDPQMDLALRRVNNPSLATVYPPLLARLFALHTSIVPPGWNLRSQVIAMRALLGVFDLATVAALVLLLRAAGRPGGLAVVYGWCPLVLKECWNSSHVDAVPAFFVTLSLLAGVRSTAAERGSADVVRSFAAGVLLGAAAAVKFYALLLSPLLARRLGLKGGACALLGAAAVIVLTQLDFPEGRERRRESLEVFLLVWENHGAVYYWLKSALHAVGLGGSAWTVPELAGVTFELRPAEVGLRCALAFAALAWAGVASWRTTTKTGTADFLRRVFTVVAVLFLVSPVGFPWYFVWCLPLLVFADRRAWFLLPALLGLYYLSFWFAYRDPGGGVAAFDRWVLSAEFGVFYTALALEAVWRRWQSGR
jgi:hypothetical protein